MKEKTFSAIFFFHFVVDLSISLLLDSLIIHVILLGVICLVSGTSLWIKSTLSIYPTFFAGVLTSIIGISALYSSIVQVGFASDHIRLFLNLALIGYVISALAPSLYLSAKE